MQRFVFFLVFLSFSQAHAAIKPCEDLKAEIAEKIDTAGVSSYVLTIVKTRSLKPANVKNGMTDKGKIVGSCENGTKKILYKKTDRTAKREPQ